MQWIMEENVRTIVNIIDYKGGFPSHNRYSRDDMCLMAERERDPSKLVTRMVAAE